MSNTNESSVGRIRRALAAGGALTAVAAAAAAVMPVQAAVAAPEEDACVLQELPMPADKYFSIVTAMSDDGSVVAYRAYPAGMETYERYPYLYEDGEATEVPMPGLDQSLNDVNEDGVAVGHSVLDGVNTPYIYKDGVLSELSTPKDGGGTTGINEDGDVVGMTGNEVLMPVVWRDGQGEPEALPLPDDAIGATTAGISDDGTIAGTVQTEDGGYPYVWHPDGTGEALPLPDHVDPAEVAANYADDIAGEWVVGYLLTPGEEAAVRWNLEDGTVEQLKLNYAPSINEEGLVGGARDPEAAVVDADSEITFLPGLVDPAENWFGDMVSEVSEDGDRLAGQVFAGEDEVGIHVLKAVLWECD